MNNSEINSDPYETQQFPNVYPQTELDRQVEERRVIPLTEEELQAVKRWTQSGEVIIRKRTENRPVNQPVLVEYEEVEIERVPVNRALAYGEQVAPRQEGDVLVIPVVEEEVVVTKRMVLREEVRVKKQRMVRQEEVSDTVRSEQISIEPTDGLEVSEPDGEGPART